jgi:hypothetical protein
MVLTRDLSLARSDKSSVLRLHSPATVERELCCLIDTGSTEVVPQERVEVLNCPFILRRGNLGMIAPRWPAAPRDLSSRAAKELHQVGIIPPFRIGVGGSDSGIAGGQRFGLHCEVGFSVDIGGVHRDVTKPCANRIDINTRGQCWTRVRRSRSPHRHGPGCGHEAVPHGDHADYLAAGNLHHVHEGHCDNHGTVRLATAAAW